MFVNFLDLIFPKTCLECGREGKYICDDCLAKARFAKPVCPYCEKPSIDGMTHTKCQRKFGLDGLTSIWAYEGVMRKAILALKYKYATEIASLLNGYIVDALKNHNSSFIIPHSNVLVPIPLHWYRSNFRGFNQSEEIGKAIAREMSWQFIPDLLIKKKSTTSQVELKGDARRSNLRGGFAINPNYQPLAIDPQPFFLFDDVVTTGSTLKEAAKVLKRGGAKKVWGLTIAR